MRLPGSRTFSLFAVCMTCSSRCSSLPQDMITAAHIGVGIAGVEGTAATNSADYAIGTFRMLHSLIFVHGFYSYQRTAKLVNFIFYKGQTSDRRAAAAAAVMAASALARETTEDSTLAFCALLLVASPLCLCSFSGRRDHVPVRLLLRHEWSAVPAGCAVSALQRHVHW